MTTTKTYSLLAVMIMVIVLGFALVQALSGSHDTEKQGVTALFERCGIDQDTAYEVGSTWDDEKTWGDGSTSFYTYTEVLLEDGGRGLAVDVHGPEGWHMGDYECP